MKKGNLGKGMRGKGGGGAEGGGMGMGSGTEEGRVGRREGRRKGRREGGRDRGADGGRKSRGQESDRWPGGWRRWIYGVEEQTNEREGEK